MADIAKNAKCTQIYTAHCLNTWTRDHQSAIFRSHCNSF